MTIRVLILTCEVKLMVMGKWTCTPCEADSG